MNINIYNNNIMNIEVALFTASQFSQNFIETVLLSWVRL